MNRGLFITVILAFMFLQGCPRIHEPWVGKERLAQERSRTSEQTIKLKHRLIRVQADR